MHIEPIEPRRLCAATPDTAFGTDGNVSFPIDHSVTNVLATGGEIYVQVFQRPRGRTVIFKYTDAGKLDTAWGRGGYIVPTFTPNEEGNLSIDKLTLVRDNRTGGLLVGDTNQADAAVTIERYSADGKLDTAWGNVGTVAYSEKRTELTLDKIVALPHKRVMLAFEREQQKGARSYDLGTKGGADDVALLKFDTRGRYDRAFNDGHALTVAIGNYASTSTGGPGLSPDRTISNDYTSPTFRDIQFFKDNSFRVISTRQQTRETTEIEGFDRFTTIGRTVHSVESTTVTAGGAVRARPSQSYVLKRVATDDDVDTEPLFFEPRAAAASADGTGVAVLFNTGGSASILRVGPGYRSGPERLPVPFGTRGVGSVVRSGSGEIIAQSVGTNSRGFGVLNLGRDLTVGRRVLSPTTDFPSFGFSTFTSDDRGRLLGEHTDIDTDTFKLTRYL